MWKFKIWQVNKCFYKPLSSLNYTFWLFFFLQNVVPFSYFLLPSIWSQYDVWCKLVTFTKGVHSWKIMKFIKLTNKSFLRIMDIFLDQKLAIKFFTAYF